ncbi:alpha-galactosidase [Salinigranum marinum]|uniref:alpha-galactosidase n=1 Tax=Salinigranum marinum TaxID=1515595 RepID=UPI002989D8B3|nr:alpha-galactosidase [Salinigranum marinum]
MPTVALIGAGSMVFARTLVGDILSFPELADSTLRLMDVDEARLDRTERVARAMVANEGLDADVVATTDRREALADADYVLNMINVGGREPFENEIRIPLRYGVEQAIGDTIGPGGIFRALRTIPTLLDIAADVEELCPDALFLNYTNPMTILCWTLFEATDVETVGLCHSVQHTVEAVADYLDLPADEIDHWVAGINHLAWLLELEHEGEDLTPRLRAAADEEAIYRQDTVRFEMLKHFGAFPTESSHHLSEYVPYFRTDPETIEELTGERYAGRMETASYLQGWTERTAERETALDDDLGDVGVERSEEYASRLIHSIETDTPRRFNLNVSNETNAIEGFPTDACVEVPCLVDGSGVHPCSVGELPVELAAFDRQHLAVYELVVRAALDHDRDALHRAMKLDPLTAAACTLDEIHELTEELLAANDAYLPKFD